MGLIRNPANTGLYDPTFEHDACGIGCIASIKGKKSHDIVQQAIDILRRLKHRGGQGSDPNTGDGAGILTQIPHALFVRECKKENIVLPAAGQYGVGMLFLPDDPSIRQLCKDRMERIVKEEGQHVLGWRTVPTNETVLGESAQLSKPHIIQLFIGAAPDLEYKDELSFERKLYIIRKRAETGMRSSPLLGTNRFYFASLSSRTIVYKGLLLPDQIDSFYLDLLNPEYVSALALVHSRFSTNTFPSWERAHPYRYVIHNGEINTIKGNVNWMRAREIACTSEHFEDMSKIRPVIDMDGSDSSMLDNCLEFLLLSGRSLAHSMMMMIPEPWVKGGSICDDRRAFYEYHSCLMEPWDGPAAVAFTDGKQIGACLDRNGLRPARYCVTKDDRIILSSEVGVVDVAPENIKYKDRLRPGQMLLVDIEQGRIVPDFDLKHQIAREHPYREWLDNHLIKLENLPRQAVKRVETEPLARLQHTFGYTFEELNKMLKPLATTGDDPVGSMGYDAPLAVLSDRPQLLYSYFKQMFAQVTNPPIDVILEEMITSVEVMIGSEQNLLDPAPNHCRRIRLSTPILTDEELERIRQNRMSGLRAAELSMVFPASMGAEGLEQALDRLFASADKAIEEGAGLLILSDRGTNRQQAPIPALLAVAGLHHHLIRNGTRTRISIVVESGEPHSVHHLALLLSYGASAVNPYVVFASLEEMIAQGQMEGTWDEAVRKYIYGVTKGILKVSSKMGISTVQSYIGAQIFEAIGISPEVIETYFTWTPSRMGGIRLSTIAREVLLRHEKAYPTEGRGDDGLPLLESGDDFQWRQGGEAHLFNPQTIHTLQYACRQNDYNMFKKYSGYADEEAKAKVTLRGLLEFKPGLNPVPIDEVEPVESILRRFKTGAMSFGSISKEAHETLAIAMNRIGGRSNSGEGGEDPSRYVADPHGDSRNSAIKQVASGRFGVTSHYLAHAEEIQIKMAQGAKPGEGGQLPAYKVYPWIAKARNSTPGVELISPPPHHDIYSIEDLAELIYDLKNANQQARINVKLVSEAGVGTIAAGVAKARADVILISGYDGGTGAASRTSIQNCGIPWEIGLAEAHQTLVLNGLRGRVALETDGKLMTGRDVVIAALLGAEEFGFSTVPLVAIGCIMMRVCHLDTCPVGIATQNPELRANYTGEPEHVIHFMRFIAQEMREYMAALGFRTVAEMVGRSDVLRKKAALDHWKARDLDLSLLLERVGIGSIESHRFRTVQDHGLNQTLDQRVLVPLCRKALENKERVRADMPIHNTDRVVGTILGNEVTRRYGAEGLPEDTIELLFRGSAGQSFGSFLPRGITLTLEGDANDHVGKGLSGGKIAIFPSPQATFAAEENIIIGNVAFYGATAGEAYIRGVAGERFCVRNSGANVVVEGVGQHGCEYMTGGHVVVLGDIGKNFAAGMSGGMAYLYNTDFQYVEQRCNLKLVRLEWLIDRDEIDKLKTMIENHARYTQSRRARHILDHWGQTSQHFIRIVPRDYDRMVKTIKRYEQTGISKEEALMAAFTARKNG